MSKVYQVLSQETVWYVWGTIKKTMMAGDVWARGRVIRKHETAKVAQEEGNVESVSHIGYGSSYDWLWSCYSGKLMCALPSFLFLWTATDNIIFGGSYNNQSSGVSEMKWYQVACLFYLE